MVKFISILIFFICVNKSFGQDSNWIKYYSDHKGSYYYNTRSINIDGKVIEVAVKQNQINEAGKLLEDEFLIKTTRLYCGSRAYQDIIVNYHMREMVTPIAILPGTAAVTVDPGSPEEALYDI